MYYFIIVISIILNGVIIVSNTAMNSVNKNKIKQLAEEGNKSAIALQDLLDKAMVYRFTNRLLSYTFFAVGIIYKRK